MVGFPGETISQINDTVRLAREIGLDWYPLQVVTFFSNTAMTNKMLGEGLLSEDQIVDVRFFNGVAGKEKM